MLAHVPIKQAVGTSLVVIAMNAASGFAGYAGRVQIEWPFVAVVKRIDAQTLVAFYRGLQPLFQQAYEELGNPNGSFNTRLLEVIDHLLQTPDVAQSPRLVQPSVVYKYWDAQLEGRSAGQKLLIRMGPANAGVMKAKLREIRSALG